ncbi:glycosyltransferase [Desulfovibrio sp. OttesenSCG-928-G15]|nr:glycosyltransferase [Desulfovibrio sp. OttesenSCG-928-G15]
MRFTIISSVLNSGPSLKDTVHSVFTQTYSNFEHIIQDGCSSDGSTDFLRAMADERLRVFQEKDSGIYDAWNKALEKAEGDWAIFLGAGDLLLTPTVLEQCAAQLANAPAHTVLAYGGMLMGPRGKAEQRVQRTLRTVYSRLSTHMSIPFTATFVRVCELKRLGFDSSFRIAGDYDFVVRAISHDNVLRLPFMVSFMEDGGVSSNEAYTALFKQERRRVAETRIIPKAEEIIRGCVAHLEESTCCGARKKIRRGERLLAALRRQRIVE